MFKWDRPRVCSALRCEKILKSTGPWVLKLERSSSSRLVNLEMELGIGPMKLLPPIRKACKLGGEDVFPNSSVPSSWLSLKSIEVKEGMVKREDGRVPLRALSLASKKAKLDSEVMLGGSVPVNLFEESIKVDSLVIFSNALGKFPYSLLENMLKRIRRFRLPKEDGISPMKLLVKKWR